MNKLKLLNDKVYTLVVNGLQIFGETAQLLFQFDGLETFEQIEQTFSTAENTKTMYVLNDDNEPIQSINGYTQCKGLEKVKDYVISTQTVNTGTSEEPVYETEEKTGPVMIITLSKPGLEKRVQELEEEVSALKVAALNR